MCIEFENMGNNSELYKTMWGEDKFYNSFLKGNIEKTYNYRYKKESDNSFSFKENKCECKAKTLSRIFEIEKKELFCSKYDIATSGSGNEATRILTLHSSSLCALLHFYNVTDDNSLTLEFTTNKRRKVKFTKSYFEYKNNVINNPSNMDIVLMGKDGNEDIVLFLESKFSEYLGVSSVSNNISQEYKKNDYSKPLYEESLLNEMGLHIENGKKGYFKLKSDGEQFYIGGIKQMISHYVGVMNAINKNLFKGEKPEEHGEVDNAIEKTNATIILGEIIFDDKIGTLKLKSNKSCAEIYKEKYKILASEIEQLPYNKDRFEIISETLSYSLFNDKKIHRIEPKIREFYRH